MGMINIEDKARLDLGMIKDQVELRRFFEALESRFGFPGQLTLMWNDLIDYKELDNGMRINGQVVGNRIIVYTRDLEEAKENVVHEFIEHFLVEDFIRPYRDLTVGMFQIFEDTHYRHRERLVKMLTRFIMKEVVGLLKENGNSV